MACRVATGTFGFDRGLLAMRIPSLLLVAGLIAVAPSHAQPPSGLTAGEVRKVDKLAGRLSIAHDAIENLKMPKMTMAFRVKEPGMLDKVKEGDKVRFAAEKIDGRYTVTHIETSK